MVKKGLISQAEICSGYMFNNGLIDDMPPTETADAPLTKDQREELYQQYCLGNTDSGCFGKILNDNWEMTY